MDVFFYFSPPSHHMLIQLCGLENSEFSDLLRISSLGGAEWHSFLFHWKTNADWPFNALDCCKLISVFVADTVLLGKGVMMNMLFDMKYVWHLWSASSDNPGSCGKRSLETDLALFVSSLHSHLLIFGTSFFFGGGDTIIDLRELDKIKWEFGAMKYAQIFL